MNDMNDTQNEQPKELGVIHGLNDALIRGRKILDKPDLMFGPVRMWILSVRAQLRKIFGQESEVLGLFPPLVGSLPSSEARLLLAQRLVQLERFVDSMMSDSRKVFSSVGTGKIFIGHGRSLVWHEAKDFIAERLKLSCDEFNRASAAGLPTFERLSQMLNEACFAFLIMTAEDEHVDATFHARENVIHEVGLFQGHLGPRKAIILLENGCQEFSNIHGLTYIPFPRGHVTAAFEKMRQVLEREGILKT